MANPELRKTVLVGLGGAGQLILMHVKRLFLDTYNVIPPCVKLLSLDTDGAQERLRSNVRDQDYRLDPHEFLHLHVAQARVFVENDPVVRNWYIGPVTVVALENGAGAIRQNGRVGLFHHIVDVKRQFENLVTELNDLQLPGSMRTARTTLDATTDFALSEKPPEIYVCGSLAGGTGSGTFLDVGILLRDLMPTALIHGFFLLNWVYRNKAFAHRVRGNAYAALAEVDNLQSIMYGVRGPVPYTVRYGSREINVKEPPYSLFHIVDGRNERGENIDDVRALCETVANAIFLSVGAMSYPTASVTDNLLKHISVASPQIWEGRNPRYSSFGVSAIYYPALELQRLLVAQNALQLCLAAIADVKGGMLAGTAIPDVQRIKEAVQAFFTNTEITRKVIRTKICPFGGDIVCQPEPFEIADPTLLKPKADGLERQLEAQLAAAFAGAGTTFINGTLDALRLKIKELEADPKLTMAYRQQWLNQAAQGLHALDHEAATQLNDAVSSVNEHRKEAQDLLDIALKSRHIWLVGGPRKSAVGRWASAVEELLKALKEKMVLEYERKFYDALLKFVDERRPAIVPRASDAMDALRAAADHLAERAALEERNLMQLKAMPTVTLVGNGSGVIVPHEKDPFCSPDSVRLGYDDFKSENGIHTGDDYIRKNREVPQTLAGLFVTHCQRKLNHLTNVTVHQALKTVGEHRGDVSAYITEQVDDLFRKAAPLWRFHRSRLSGEQSEQYDYIVNLGVDDPEAASRAYGSTVAAIKKKYHIRADHAFSASGDPLRIWLLNFAAALPAYFLQGLEEGRERYHEEITPTYHIDPVFEMNVPDLFPLNDIQNRALRVLGMAIVDGIDVIRDEKLGKGHKFTCEIGTLKAKNHGEPKVWFLFRDMLREATEDHNLKVTDNLLDLLSAALKAKVASMATEDLRRAIQAHTSKFETKLAQRDFSRLISARLTYRETKELKDFLDAKGYAMDIDRYIAGR